MARCVQYRMAKHGRIVFKTLATVVLIHVIYLAAYLTFYIHRTDDVISDVRSSGVNDAKNKQYVVADVGDEDQVDRNVTDTLADRYARLAPLPTPSSGRTMPGPITATPPVLGKIYKHPYHTADQLEAWVDMLHFCVAGRDYWKNEITPPEMLDHVGKYCAQLPARIKTFYTKGKVKVNHFEHVVIKDGGGVCDSRPDVLVIVHSYHDYFDRRTAIRRTWGGAVVERRWPREQIQEKVKLVFVFGIHSDPAREQLLAEESRIYGDVIQGDFGESYRNMTLKNLLGLRWAATHCLSAQYIVKSDDDMFINFPALFQVVSPLKSQQHWITGPLNINSMVHRIGKWEISPELFPFHTYPPYHSGAAYVLSADLALPLLEASEYFPHIFIDDAYVTGILGKVVGVKHVSQHKFAYATTAMVTVCQLMDYHKVTGTRVTPEIMTSLWTDLRDGRRTGCK